MKDMLTMMLGETPAERKDYALRILRLGFGEKVIAYCPTSNDTQEFTIEEAANRMATNDWPRCCDQRMSMESPESLPPF